MEAISKEKSYGISIMSEKNCKELRRKAHNEWIGYKKEYQKLFTVKQVYKQMKKDLKNKKRGMRTNL